MGHLGPEDISSRRSKTVAPIFTNKTSFSQESWKKPSKVMKPQKIYWPWCLETRNFIWATWAQKTYPTKSLEPWLQYPQSRPHFFENCKINLVNYFKSQKIYWPRGLGPRDDIWATWARATWATYPAISPEMQLHFS